MSYFFNDCDLFTLLGNTFCHLIFPSYLIPTSIASIIIKAKKYLKKYLTIEKYNKLQAMELFMNLTQFLGGWQVD